MKVLFFTDLHGSLASMKEIQKKSEKADMLVCAGDLTIFENDMDLLLKDLNDLGKTCLMIHGNHEDDWTMKKACRKLKHIKFIHESFFKRDGIIFLGYGGGGFSQVDLDFGDNIEPKFAKLMKDARKSVIIFHGPPHKTRLDNLHGDYVGNKSYTRFIKKHQPDLVICGHIHENNSKEDKIKKTRVVNPGPAGRIISL